MEFLKVERYTAIEKKHHAYLQELSQHCKKSGRHPKFHIHPPTGLMNDPNGLAYYNGEYHVFYQWFPFEPIHGMKHWAHVTSKDLIQWKWSEEMLIPNEEYEKNGCYSGNALEVGGRLNLFYTANYKTDYGKVPKQALAWLDQDGKIHKHKGNPVIDEIPSGLIEEIRDPFVFEKDGTYCMLLGGGDLKHQGQLLLYQSKDLKTWEYQGNIEISVDGKDLGYMFECPSYIQVDGKDVLLLSLMGMKKEGYRYQNEFSSVYFIGNLDLQAMRFEVETYDELDKGFDFYAPQAFYGKNHEPMLFAWFGCGMQTLPYSKEDMWIHGLTMPRKLEIKNGKLCQRMMEEVDQCFHGIVFNGQDILRPKETTWKLHLDFDKKLYREIQIGENDDCIRLKIFENHTILDRSHLKLSICEEYGVERGMELSSDHLQELDVYYDNTFVEIYFNGGEEVMTFRAYPEDAIVKVK